jgi:beta-lactamase class D
MKRIVYLLLAIATLSNSCSTNNVTTHSDWASYFTTQQVKGCFMLYDNGHNHIDVYNLARSQQRFLPAATFEIMSSLVGLETGVIPDTNTLINWGVMPKQKDTGSRRDIMMGEAFRLSDVPYFQAVARRVGRVILQFWIDSVKYGNMEMSKNIDSFWMDNSLKISPDEQLGLIKQLYFSKLPFHDRPQRLVRGVMLMDSTATYKLSYKTGQGLDSGRVVSWMAGWEEENKHPYFFVLNIESSNPSVDIASLRDDIFYVIMKKEGFFKGEK